MVSFTRVVISYLDKERRVLFRVVIVAQSPACAAAMVPHALGLHQGPGPSHVLPLYTAYLNYRWRHLHHLKESACCHKDKEHGSLRG